MPSPNRPRRPPRSTTVVEVSQLTPHMVRIVVEGPDLADFAVGEFTDHYVKTHHDGKTRTYTVREFDPETRRLTLDFVVHGEDGVAGPWAAAARVGDTLMLSGPGGGYAPSAGADWHLMVGDESVIPAIAVSLARVPDGVPVFVVLEVGSAADEQVLETPGELHLTWRHRTAGPGEQPELLLDAVAALELPEGQGHGFIHGEAQAVLMVRRHLIRDRGFTAEQLSATGYWKLRRTDEQWREEKRDWLAEARQDLAG
jgi:NADPH-dependent ferric siderophore reductase